MTPDEAFLFMLWTIGCTISIIWLIYGLHEKIVKKDNSVLRYFLKGFIFLIIPVANALSFIIICFFGLIYISTTTLDFLEGRINKWLS